MKVKELEDIRDLHDDLSYRYSVTKCDCEKKLCAKCLESNYTKNLLNTIGKKYGLFVIK